RDRTIARPRLSGSCVPAPQLAPPTYGHEHESTATGPAVRTESGLRPGRCANTGEWRPASRRSSAAAPSPWRARAWRGRRPGGAELGGMGDEKGLIDGAHPRRIDEDVNGDLRQLGEHGEGVGQADSAARAEVVDLARPALLGEQAIAADDVADVGEVANDVEI